MKFFNDVVVAHVWSVLQASCGGGAPITFPDLTKACGFEDKEQPLIREIVHREFKATGQVEIQLGKGGGIYLSGVERVKGQAAKADLTEDYLAKAKDALKTVFNLTKEIKVDMMAGRMNDVDSKRLRFAVQSGALPGYEIGKGDKIRKVMVPAADTTA